MAILEFSVMYQFPATNRMHYGQQCKGIFLTWCKVMILYECSVDQNSIEKQNHIDEGIETYILFPKPFIFRFQTWNFKFQFLCVSLSIPLAKILPCVKQNKKTSKIKHQSTHRVKSITCLLARDRAADSLFLIILFCLLSTVFSTTIPEATLFRPSVCVSDNVPVEGVRF
jgi:hypothetical protein